MRVGYWGGMSRLRFVLASLGENIVCFWIAECDGRHVGRHWERRGKNVEGVSQSQQVHVVLPSNDSLVERTGCEENGVS